MPRPDPDAQNVRQAQAGNEASLKQLVRQYNGRTQAFVRHLGATDLQAEEVMSETLEIMVRDIVKFRGLSFFKAWVFGIAGNLWYQKKKLLSEKTEHVPIEECSELAGSANLEPDEIARRLLRRDEVDRLLAALPAVERSALMLTYLEDLTLADAGLILGKTRGNTSMIVHRAFKRLKTLVRKTRACVGQTRTPESPEVASTERSENE